MVPKINLAFSTRSFGLGWIACGCLLLLSFSARAQTPTLDREEQMVLKLINDYRAQNGLQALRVSLALARAAD